MLTLLLLTAGASAQTRVCVTFNAAYGDNGSGTQGSGDYWTSNAVRPMPGARVWLYDLTWAQWSVGAYAEHTGSDTGCADLTTLPGHSYQIYVLSESQLAYGNKVRVLDPASVSNGHYESSGSPFWTYAGTRAHGTTTTVLIPSTLPNLLQGAMTWAILRRNAGIGSSTFRAFTTACPLVGGSCYKANFDALFTDSTSKFVFAHELGHQIGAMRNAANGSPQSTASNYEAPTAVCGPVAGHVMDTKEYQSAAANEGFAHYYAAVSWNLTNQTDCRFGYYKPVDFNHDGTSDPGSNLNCEGGPALTTPPGGSPPAPVAAGDYLADQCATPYGNRGTEYDWLRFWWDIDTDGGLSTTDIADIWDLADPYAWRPTDSGTAPLPRLEIQQAFTDAGFQQAWTSWAPYNGVDQ
ncbi:MAG: hypothetical protein H6736_17480 [Alphaproteobacteria bacterium]|nr:hypothetical protein [Alphaproteobacteria bacterium]MCB9693607.1 hypothetical protein [Alphaproteobacteria bacterium]